MCNNWTWLEIACKIIWPLYFQFIYERTYVPSGVLYRGGSGWLCSPFSPNTILSLVQALPLHRLRVLEEHTQIILPELLQLLKQYV